MAETRPTIKSPVVALRMFLLVLIVIFLAESVVMILLPLVLPSGIDGIIEAVVDSCLLTMISAPILWFLVMGPLRRLERDALRVESQAAIAQLATGVAHEVRNPLTSIKLLVQSHLESATAPTLVEDLTVIEDEIRRMELTLNTFLDFSRPRPPQRVTFDLSDVVQKTTTLLEGKVKKQNVLIDFTNSDEPFIVHADPEQMRQVLLNLCLNALEVMPKGGTLGIQIQKSDKEREGVSLSVTDTGAGVRPENIPRLFQPFFTTRETGVGLGLVISKRIAQDHGGDLMFQNRREGGACFTLQLPSAAL